MEYNLDSDFERHNTFLNNNKHTTLLQSIAPTSRDVAATPVIIALLSINGLAHHLSLSQRARRLDRTLYPLRGATKYLPYWTQLLSAAIVTADARRCIHRLGGLQVQASEAARQAARRAAAACRP